MRVWFRSRRNVNGMLDKNVMTARIKIIEPTRTPTPMAWRMFQTYPSSIAKIPAKLANGIHNVARNIAA